MSDHEKYEFCGETFVAEINRFIKTYVEPVIAESGKNQEDGYTAFYALLEWLGHLVKHGTDFETDEEKLTLFDNLITSYREAMMNNLDLSPEGRLTLYKSYQAAKLTLRPDGDYDGEFIADLQHDKRFGEWYFDVPKDKPVSGRITIMHRCTELEDGNDD